LLDRFCLSVLTLAANGVFAAELPIRDLNPLLSGYELPPALPSITNDTASLLAQAAIGNITLVQSTVAESVQMDAELQRWQIGYVTPLGNDWNLRVELPYLRISGGQLDHFIESWHHAFGLPNGNRDSVSRNQLRIQYSGIGVQAYQLTKPASGIGDVSLRIGHSVGSNEVRRSMVWLSIKLPTGNSDTLAGSGVIDFSASFASSHPLTKRIMAYGQLSLSLLGRGDRLTDQQQSTVWIGAVGVDTRITSRWSAAVQLDGHSKVFDSDLPTLGKVMQLSFGVRYQLRDWQSSLALTEDIAVDTAPDVQLQLDITKRF
jgi:hypothetical protein